MNPDDDDFPEEFTDLDRGQFIMVYCLFGATLLCVVAVTVQAWEWLLH